MAPVLYMIPIGLMLLTLLGVPALAQEDGRGNSPLNQAAIQNDLARVKTLLAERHSQDELDFSLFAAASKGRSEAALLLIAAGASPKRQVSPTGHSSVIVAIRENQLETLIVLLEHGGDPNEMDQVGWRPLHHTTGPDYERPDAIRALVQHGGVVDGRDGLQRTALHRAAGFGHAESVRVLLAVGADPSLREKYGHSASERAEQAGHHSVAQLIQSFRGTSAELEVVEPKGNTSIDITQRNPGELALGILANWLSGLFPAMVLRLLILRRPLSKSSAIWVTVGIAVLLFFTVTGLAHLGGIRPNMAPVAIWTFLTYTILRAGRQRSHNSQLKGVSNNNEAQEEAI